MIDVVIGGNLKPVDARKLGIQKIDPHDVIKKMQNDKATLQSIDAHHFTDEERVAILRTVEQEDLWKQLPLHEFNNGVYGCIDSDVFRQGRIQIPSSLTKQARFVKVSNDPVIGLRQKDWIPELSHDDVAKLALQSQSPSDYWQIILDALAEQSSDLWQNTSLLCEKAWVPLKNGNAIAPNNILHIEGMVDEMNRLVSEAGDQFATFANLPDKVKQHKTFDKVKDDVLPKGKDAFEVILCLIDVLPHYAVGIFQDGLSELIQDALPALIPIASRPGWAFIAKAAKQLGQSVGNLLSGRKMQPLGTDVVVKLLNNLAQQSPLVHTSEYKAHLLYLHSLNLDSECNSQHIAQLNLRAQDGSWQLSDALCAGVSGVTPLCLLNEDQKQALHERIFIANLDANDAARNAVEDVGLDTWLKNAEETAQNYFGNLAARTKKTAIGLLLAMMGDRYKELAQGYLSHKYPVDDHIRKMLSGDNKDKNQSSGVLLDSIKTANIVLIPIKEAVVNAPNLLGKSARFPVERNPSTLLVGTPHWVKCGNSSALIVQIASLATFAQLNGAELNAVLKRTAQEFMIKIHRDKYDHVCALWQEISQSDQLDLEIVKRKILDSLPTYLEQLGAHRHSPIKEKLGYFKRAQERYFAADTRKNDTAEINNTFQQFRKNADLLSNCITENQQAHEIVLEQMRRKLQDFQYEPDAVLFELFQNADDASVELGRCESHGDDVFEVPKPAQKFVVQTVQSTIRIMHWGRLINYCPPDLPDKWHGFGDDLKKMLVLNSSDKPDDTTVTGRFGLGFKSVFLVCDKPRIVSGDLMVEICGSILPVPWKTTETALKLLQKHTTDGVYRGTLIELCITHGKISAMRQRFEQHSGLLTVFARAIRQIEIEVEGNSNVLVWYPNLVADGVEIGKVSLPSKSNSPSTLLVVRTAEGEIALKLGTSGIETMDANVCPIWVTAPTRETDKIGFVVNGPFKIDAGRGRLAGSQEFNKGQLQKIGQLVGKRLSALYQATSEQPSWDELRGDLGLVKECSMPIFWSTIWQVLCIHTVSRADSELSKLVAELVTSAFAAWLETGVPFPNGLSDSHADFVNTGGKFVQLEDGWNDKDVLNCLNDLRKIQSSDYVIVSSFMADLLRKTGQQSKIVSLNLPYLLRSACASDRCPPEVAEIFEALVDALEHKACTLEHKACTFDLTDETNNPLHFLTVNAQWSTTSHILCNSDFPEFAEEYMRYAFAPYSCRLAASYGKPAVAFFVRCRNKMQAPTSTLVKWILEDILDLPRKIAALTYIANGELSGDVAEQVRGKGWLADISPQSELLSTFKQTQKDKILRALAKPETISKSWDNAAQIENVTVSPVILQGDDALNAIYEWWNKEGARYLQAYDDKFWPREIPRKFDSTDDNRAFWMTLFGIGLMQRHGRAQDQQHKGFIDLMHGKEWWHVFSMINPRDDGQAWLNVLKEYGESQTENETYSQWMDIFPRLYRVARWFDGYTHAFLSLNQRDRSQTASYLSSRADPLMSGSGIDAPPMLQSFKLGQHVVIRELLRFDVLYSETAKAMAFKPNTRVKEILARIGFGELEEKNVTSEQIYDVLRKCLGNDATFNRAYDIPLLVLARDPGLQQKILGITTSTSESDFSDDD